VGRLIDNVGTSNQLYKVLPKPHRGWDEVALMAGLALTVVV